MSEARLNDFVERRAPRRLASSECERNRGASAGERLDAAIHDLWRRSPELSARHLMSAPQQFVAAVLVGLTAALALCPVAAIAAISLAAAFYFLLAAAFKSVLAAIGLKAPAARAAPSPREEDLPTVTILLPVFGEAKALPLLAEAMGRLDYPREKLDIKLLLEARDVTTIAEARRLQLDRAFECVVVPDAAPRTKPKACNYGLQTATGALTVIYDAEDEPEADQLRKAAAQFLAADDRLACLQARLNFYNRNDNFLTRLFALEYALWFDLMLPALERLGLPVPLGGTSNIFRTDILRKIGGWDPFNVTEDADLGFRLARLGYRTRMLDSTTFEEANCRLGNWLNQRSRWMKGYLQTWAVHMRDAKGFRRATGLKGLAALHLFVAGNVFSALINPVLVAVAILDAFSAFALPEWLQAANVVALLAGNLLFIALASLAPMRRGWRDLLPYALLAPLYWQLASIGAWRGFCQLFVRPFHWEKTEHVISRAAKQRRAAVLSAQEG
jgi:cellulose synthase/poly-beta-1,6-N-acetylglucosamine synthase-like glycosyltransferase